MGEEWESGKPQRLQTIRWDIQGHKYVVSKSLRFFKRWLIVHIPDLKCRTTPLFVWERQGWCGRSRVGILRSRTLDVKLWLPLTLFFFFLSSFFPFPFFWRTTRRQGDRTRRERGETSCYPTDYTGTNFLPFKPD